MVLCWRHSWRLTNPSSISMPFKGNLYLLFPSFHTAAHGNNDVITAGTWYTLVSFRLVVHLLTFVTWLHGWRKCKMDELEAQVCEQVEHRDPWMAQNHGPIMKPFAPGPGHVKGPLPFARKNCALARHYLNVIKKNVNSTITKFTCTATGFTAHIHIF